MLGCVAALGPDWAGSGRRESQWPVLGSGGETGQQQPQRDPGNGGSLGCQLPAGWDPTAGRLPSPSSPSPAVKRDPGHGRCQAVVGVLPVKGSISNLGALPQPEGPGVVVCIWAGSGKRLLQPHLACLANAGLYWLCGPHRRCFCITSLGKHISVAWWGTSVVMSGRADSPWSSFSSVLALEVGCEVMGKEPPNIRWPLVLISIGETPSPEHPCEHWWVAQGTGPRRLQGNPPLPGPLLQLSVPIWEALPKRSLLLSPPLTHPAPAHTQQPPNLR